MKKSFLVLCLLVQVCYSVLAQEQIERDSIYSFSLEQLMNIDVITASKISEKSSDAPGVISTITSREIEQFGGLSLVEILERVTGVVNMSASTLPQNIVSFRGDLSGISNNHTLILINGRPNRESLYGGTDYSIFLGIPITAIDKIEIIRGPGSVLYGSNAFSGVVNIILKKGGDQLNKVSTYLGSFGGVGIDGYVGYAKNDLNVMVGYKNFNEKGWDFIATDIAGVTDTTSYGETNSGLALRLGYKGLTVNSLITESNQTIFGSGLIWDSSIKNEIYTKRASTDIGYEINYNKKASTRFNATINSFRVKTGAVSGESDDLLLEVSNFFQPIEKLNIVLGATAYKQTGYLLSGTTKIVPDYNKMWYNGYLQADYRPITPLKLIAGVQVNKIEGINVNVVPRFGAIYNLTQHIGIKALYGEAFRAAYGIETDIVTPVLIGNKNLEPETLKNLDLQFFYAAKKLELAVTYFDNSKKNNILRGTGGRFTNAGTNDSYGIEVEGKYISGMNFYITGSYAYQTNELKSADGTLVEEASLMPNHVAKLGVNYQASKGISIGIYNMYVSQFNTFTGQESLPKNNGDTGGFNSLSANVNLNLSKLFDFDMSEEVILSLFGNNLLDETVNIPDISTRAIYSIPGRSGRSLYATLSIKF